MKRILILMVFLLVVGISQAFGQGVRSDLCGMPDNWIKDGVTGRDNSGQKLYDWYYNPELIKVRGGGKFDYDSFIFYIGIVYTDLGMQTHHGPSNCKCHWIILQIRSDIHQYRVWKYHLYSYTGKRISMSEEFPYGEDYKTPSAGSTYERTLKVAFDLIKEGKWKYPE